MVRSKYLSMLSVLSRTSQRFEKIFNLYLYLSREVFRFKYDWSFHHLESPQDRLINKAGRGARVQSRGRILHRVRFNEVTGVLSRRTCT